MIRRRKKNQTKPLHLALLIIILMAAYYFLHQPGEKRPAKESITGLHAVRIIDGDTFRDSKGQSVRLLGIDTPEKGDTFSIQATHALDSLLEGRVLRYEFDQRKRDRYGRILAYVFTDEAFVNRVLLKKGLAEVYIYPSDMKNIPYRTDFIGDQTIARDSSFGIWSLPVRDVEDYYVGNTNTLRFHRPSCPSADKLNSDHRLILQSRDEFLDMGYSPCRNCNP